MVLAAIGPYKNTNGTTRSVKGWFYPVITFSFLAFSMIYYCIFLASEKSSGVSIAGVTLKRRRHGVDDNSILMRQCDMCKEYERGEEHRHLRDGYLYFNELILRQQGQRRNPLYWLFGGQNEEHDMPTTE